MSILKMSAACLLLGGPAAMAADVRLGERPMLAGGSFSSGGGLTIAAERHVIDGQPHICGVWARSEQLSSYVIHKVRDVLQSGVVIAGGQTVYRDFRAFRQVNPAASYAGAEARCVRIDGGAGSVTLRIPSQVVEKSRGLASSIQVDFR